VTERGCATRCGGGELGVRAIRGGISDSKRSLGGGEVRRRGAALAAEGQWAVSGSQGGGLPEAEAAAGWVATLDQRRWGWTHGGRRWDRVTGHVLR
jgi:hypothetical protein